MSEVKTAYEYPKNANPEVRISCSVCKKDYRFVDVLQEQPMPPPYETVVEGFLLCPTCGDRRHIYYLTEYLRFLQVQLKQELDRWITTRDPAAWREYAAKQKSFQLSYDNAQKRYAAIFRKEAASEPGG